MKCPSLLRPLSAISAGWLLLTATTLGQTPYDFGNPTAEEQLYMELINRARAAPPAEGARLAATTDPNVLSAISQFNVNLALMQSEFNAIPVAPPLAHHASLLAAARSHSAWMLANATQSHYESNPYNDPWQRIAAAGYVRTYAGENVFAHASGVWHGHAGFQIDWGAGTGGMQSPRGHRDTIHNPNFREVGVGVVSGTNGDVGPQLVTQDFGSRSSIPNLGTGVAYYDINGNQFYDLGEGIGGLTVNVSGVAAYCLTAVGGGWVVPCPTTAANRTVTFSGLNVNQNVPIVFPASANAKADLKLAYSPPTVTSPATTVAGSPHNLSFTPVGGATSYTWTRSTTAAAPTENCDSAAGITTSTSGGYAVLNTAVKQQGSASFHLANPGTSQSFQLNSLFHAGSSPSLYFQSLVRYSTSDERFKVQVKQEGTAVWQDVYSQTGYNGPGEAAFTLRSAALGAMAGSSFRVRFTLDYSSGSLYGDTGDIFGWFIDAISFSGVSVLGGTVTESLAGTSGSFTPAAGTYLMAVAPVISGNDFPAAYQTLTVIQHTSFASWAAGYAASYSLPAGTLSNAAGDYDKDGRTHLIEYAFGTSPVLASEPTPRLPVAELTATYFILRYQRDSSLTDLTLTPQASTTLGAWKAPGEAGAPAGFTDTLVSTAGNLQTREAKVPRSSGATIFMRVKVTLP